MQRTRGHRDSVETRRPRLLSVGALVALLFPAGAASLFAEGDEILMRPDENPLSLLTVATGSGFVAAGVGLAEQPATLSVTVPEGVVVKQVVFYVVGRGTDVQRVRDLAAINGATIRSTLGRPNLIGTSADCAGSATVGCPDPDLPSHTLRKEITDLGLIGPGENTLEISGVDFGTPGQNNGAGVVVIYDDGSGDSTLLLADGSDFDWWRWDNAAQMGVDEQLGNTVPVTFPFDPSPTARTASLSLFFADGKADRRDEILITVGGVTTTLPDLIDGADGPDFDTIDLEVEIPAGASEVTVEAVSPQPAGPGDNPDSFSWAVAVISVPPCVGRIGDLVWEDLNRDGCQDPEEPGVPGVRVVLRESTGDERCECSPGGEVLATTETDENGRYIFEGLCPGRYCVAFEVPAGYERTAPNEPCEPGDEERDSDCTGSGICVVLSTGRSEDLSIDCGLVAERGGGQGCTPGYWKQRHHFDSWTAPYTPDTPFGDVFENAFPRKTLLQVLKQGGGGLNALGRHVVAALLNSASGGVSYDLSAAEVIEMFNDVHPGRKKDYEALKNMLEHFNEQGCPLN